MVGNMFLCPYRTNAADGAQLNETARQLPHLEGIHLKNTTLYGKEQSNHISAFVAMILVWWFFHLVLISLLVSLAF
jgi:hypothetical protein